MTLVDVLRARLEKILEFQQGLETPERWREICQLESAISTLQAMSPATATEGG